LGSYFLCQAEAEADTKAMHGDLDVVEDIEADIEAEANIEADIEAGRC